MKKFAVILSGCGVYDGTEIHEAVTALLAIDRADHHYDLFAPDRMQHHVINHLSGQETDERRNILVESARIARGKILPLTTLDPAAYDGLVLPGGFGAAKNLSDYAFAGAGMKVLPEVEEVLKKMHALKKPIGAMCISPVILAKVFGNVHLTIGRDAKTAGHLEQLGAVHHVTEKAEVTIDPTNKLVTTPCYMTSVRISYVAAGAEAMIRAMLDLM